jgi:hypothetical protein
LFCGKCGKEHDASFPFCPFCGNPANVVSDAREKADGVAAPKPAGQAQPASSTSTPEAPYQGPPQQAPLATPTVSQAPFAQPPTPPPGGPPISQVSPGPVTLASRSARPTASLKKRWSDLSGKAKAVILISAAVILVIILIAAISSLGGGQKQVSQTPSETGTPVATPSKTASDYISTDVFEGQEVTTGACAVNGTVKEDCTITLNGQPVAVDATTKRFGPVINIAEGPNTLTFSIKGSSGNSVTRTLTLVGVLSPETYKAVSPPGPDFAHLNKDPDSYSGTRCKYTGKIVQIMQSGGSTDIRMDITHGAWDIWSDTIYVNFQGTTPAVQDNIITVYGAVKGSYTYTSQADYKITLPLVEAKYVDVQ